MKAKENTVMLFKSKYPQEDILMLEKLTLSQYNEIFKALIENKDLKIINDMIFYIKNPAHMKKHTCRIKCLITLLKGNL